MKAAVLHQLGTNPIYETFPDPIPKSDEQLLITVKAASIKNLDKGRASGSHYASYKNLPTTVGFDGVGTLRDGTRVYAQGITGMIAEKALIPANSYTPIPDGLDDVIAAALPNAVIGAAMALRFRAAIQPGQVVLVNGATGVTGQFAVQLAKHYGAATVIATGRNEASLGQLKTLGADTIISLKEDEETILKQLKEAHSQTPIDIVIDYLWGRPVELILTALKGEGVHALSHKVRIVTVGDMAGKTINLPSGTLRSSPIKIMGSGLGSLSNDEMHRYMTEVLPEMFALAATGKLTMDVETVPLQNIETAWQQEVAPARRLVVLM